MATATGKTRCVTCEKEKTTSKCSGCLKDFCFNHLVEHRQQLEKQFDDLENERNIFRQNLTELKTHPETHFLNEQINQWERQSIKKIRETADEERKVLFNYIQKHFITMENQLDQLTKQLKETREGNDFNEKILLKLQNQLKELEKPPIVSIQEDSSSSFINKISVITNSVVEKPSAPNIKINTKWNPNGITVAGGNGEGVGLNQLSKSWGICVGDKQTIYVAEENNHRIVEWKNGASSGQVVAGGNGQGSENNQLNWPMYALLDHDTNSLIISDSGNQRVVRWSRQNGRTGETIISNVKCWGLAVDRNGYLYVSDTDKDEVRRWKIGQKNGTLVAGGNGKGDGLNQFNEPRYIFVDQDESIYISDNGNHRVMKWVKGAKEGVVVAGGHGKGNSVKQLSFPQGIIVDQFGTVYVADLSNNRVMRWLKGAREGEVIVGGNGAGNQPNQLNYPAALAFDCQDNLYVVDRDNYRVQKFFVAS